MSSTPRESARAGYRELALRLEYLSVGWTLIEAAVGIIAALAASSVALLGFGIDSVIETLSAGVLIWRLRAERYTRERAALEQLDRRAHRLVAFLLIALSLYIVADAAWTLWHGEHPHPSTVGLVLTGMTMVVMYWLARAKRRAAAALESRALRADSFQAVACLWLSVFALVGVGLNMQFGWWWADPVAALCMPPILIQEARQAWRGEDCC